MPEAEPPPAHARWGTPKSATKSPSCHKGCRSDTAAGAVVGLARAQGRRGVSNGVAF